MGKESVDLSIQDDFGWAYVPVENFRSAMQVLRFKEDTGWGRAVHYFRGTLYDLRVEVVATAVKQGTLGWRYARYRQTPTHYKVKGYLPESIHISGKGRDKRAWDIYRQITATLEEAIGEDYSAGPVPAVPAVHATRVSRARVPVYPQVNRGEFKDGIALLGEERWMTLTPVQVKQYLAWRVLSDSRWVDEYKVTVRVAARGRVREYRFMFEERADAVKCEQWFRELGFQPMLKVL